MSFEQRDGSGVLFRNEKKEKDNPAHAKRPDYTGSITINGEEHKLAAWIRDSRKGKFMSISVDEDRAKTGKVEQARQMARGPMPTRPKTGLTPPPSREDHAPREGEPELGW